MAETELQGRMIFNINVSLTADEIGDRWSPEKVKAWFDGVAQVVRAAEESATIEITNVEQLEGAIRHG